jgi:choline kinase
MKAIILAAGRGSRMNTLTETQPKCLIEIHGKSLLDRQLDTFRETGITQIAIITGYKKELLINRGLVEFHNPRWSQTNMVSSLACADEWLSAESCIVSYSDIFYTRTAIDSLTASTDSLALTYDPNWLDLWTQRFGDPLLDAETFRINTENFLVEIGSKPNTTDEIMGQYMGLLRITPEAWAEISRIRSTLLPDERDSIHMTGMLQKIIEAKRVPIYAIPYKDKWGEVDSAFDLAIAETQAQLEVMKR